LIRKRYLGTYIRAAGNARAVQQQHHVAVGKLLHQLFLEGCARTDRNGILKHTIPAGHQSFVQLVGDGRGIASRIADEDLAFGSL
jgi:hypothetical protein